MEDRDKRISGNVGGLFTLDDGIAFLEGVGLEGFEEDFLFGSCEDVHGIRMCEMERRNEQEGGVEWEK